jgi:raffinose/stachyose/melibiose transport system permease protein
VPGHHGGSLPAPALYAFMILVPSGRGPVFAFTNWNGLNQAWQFAGLANSRHIVHGPALMTPVVTAVAVIRSPAAAQLKGIV